MVKRKVCSSCRLFVDGAQCPSCKSTKFTTNWQGRLYISDPKKSFIASQIGIKVKGEYAVKCR